MGLDQFADVLLGQIPTKIDPRVYDALLPDDSARIEDSVASDLAVLTQDCPKFSHTSLDFIVLPFHIHRTTVKLQV